MYWVNVEKFLYLQLNEYFDPKLYILLQTLTCLILLLKWPLQCAEAWKNTLKSGDFSNMTNFQYWLKRPGLSSLFNVSYTCYKSLGSPIHARMQNVSRSAAAGLTYENCITFTTFFSSWFLAFEQVSSHEYNNSWI